MDLQKYFSVKKLNGKVQQVIAKETAETLMKFCNQEAEFLQAVEQSGKSFQDCLNYVAHGITDGVSDAEVYSRAAEFYFPGAVVHCEPVIDLIGNAAPKQNGLNSLTASFDSLADW